MGGALARILRAPLTISKYSDILEDISRQIREEEKERYTKREQEKRWRKGVVVYSGIAWLLLAVFLFFWKPPENTAVRKQALKVGPLLLFPLVPYGLLRLLDAFFRRTFESIDERLKQLDVLKKEKMEELLKATGFQEIQRLLDRHRTGAEAKSVEKEMKKEEARRKLESEHGPEAAQRVMAAAAAAHAQHPNPELNEPDLSLFQRADIVLPQRRGVLEKVVDALLGDGPNNRYALICPNCFTHNGLVFPNDMDIPYRCRSCGFFRKGRLEKLEQQAMQLAEQQAAAAAAAAAAATTEQGGEAPAAASAPIEAAPALEEEKQSEPAAAETGQEENDAAATPGGLRRRGARPRDE